MKRLDEEVEVQPEQRFDASVAVPAGSSYDIVRRLVGLADVLMYQAKTSFRNSREPHLCQKNVRIINGRLMET
jgi:hypothetical protein